MKSPLAAVVNNPLLDRVRAEIFQTVFHYEYLCQDMESLGHVLSILAIELADGYHTTGEFNSAARRQRIIGYDYMIEFLLKRIELGKEGKKSDAYLARLIKLYDSAQAFPTVQNNPGMAENKTYPRLHDDLRNEIGRGLDKIIASGVDAFIVSKAVLDACCVCYALIEEDLLRYQARLEVTKDHVERLSLIQEGYDDAINDFEYGKKNAES